MRKLYLTCISLFIIGIFLMMLVLTSCGVSNKKKVPEQSHKLSDSGKNLPKVQISDEGKSIDWMQGDSFFEDKTNGGTNITYYGAKREDAIKLPGVQIKNYSTLSINADSIEGLSTPKISAMLYNGQGKIVNYTLIKKNGLFMDVEGGEYLWMLYVDWGKGNNNSIYWFKVNVPKDKVNQGPGFTEPGPVPVSVIWKRKEYQVIGSTTKDIGERLGTAVSTGNAGSRDIYSIKGYDSKKEIAVKQLGGLYFKAVAFSAQEKEWMIKQRVLDDMYIYVTTKKFNVPDCDFNYQMNSVIDETNRLTYSDSSQYKSVIMLLKTEKYKEAADSIDKLQGGVSEVKYKPNESNVYYTSAYDSKSLKELGIKLNSTSINPEIDKNEVLKIAEDMQHQSSIKPKGIYLEYGLLTDNNLGISAISKEAMDANPILKDKKSLSDIPVWIITFKGLLPDDYKQDTSRMGKQPLDISSTVIDAMTGKVLFGFGCGKE